MKLSILAAAAAVVLASAPGALAAVVQFAGSPDGAFADGTFSHDLTSFSDGFYSLTSTSAFNGYGANNETITWNSDVTFNSLKLRNYCCEYPITITASLFSAGNTFITSQTINSTGTNQLLTFDTSNVKTLKISFTGGTSNFYNDNRLAAWYEISDVTYSANAIGAPEPVSWALMVGGFGLAGAALRRRQARFAA